MELFAVMVGFATLRRGWWWRVTASTLGARHDRRNVLLQIATSAYVSTTAERANHATACFATTDSQTHVPLSLNSSRSDGRKVQGCMGARHYLNFLREQGDREERALVRERRNWHPAAVLVPNACCCCSLDEDCGGGNSAHALHCVGCAQELQLGGCGKK